MDLIKRNLMEIVTDEELDLLVKKKTPVTYCGYEVSGRVHIGTMIAINKQIDFQDAGFEVKVLFADVHTLLNRKGEEDWIEKMAGYWKNCFIACGLNKGNTEFILGSEFQFGRDYIHDILELGLLTSVKRARRSMQDVARDLDHARVSQMIYPLMQVADIKALDVDIAHGGMEQRKIHMLARELLPEIGHKKPVCVHTSLLCSLQGSQGKMSSSKPETIIAIDESDKSINKKINSAYCPVSNEGNPVLEICKYLIFPRLNKLKIKRNEKFGGDIEFNSYSELEDAYLNNKLHPMDLKQGTATGLIEILTPIREELAKKGVEYPG